MKEYPFIDKDGKLYEAFPCVTLFMNNGSKIEVDYFGSRSLSFIPTRYMLKDDNSIIPTVKYLSSFKSEKDVMIKFLSEIHSEMKDYHMNVFKVTDTTFVNWDNVSSLDVKMNHYVYCYENPIFTGNSKFVKSENEAKFIGLVDLVEFDDEMTIEIGGKKDDEIDMSFLECPLF